MSEILDSIGRRRKTRERHGDGYEFVRDQRLETEFQTEQGVVKALRGIDYTVDKGEVLGIVGESGSGKSVGMLSMMGLLAPNGTVTAGEMIFDGEDISPG